MSLGLCDIDELKSRVLQLVEKYERLVDEISPKMRELGLVRNEIGLIYAELEKRGEAKK